MALLFRRRRISLRFSRRKNKRSFRVNRRSDGREPRACCTALPRWSDVREPRAREYSPAAVVRRNINGCTTIEHSLSLSLSLSLSFSGLRGGSRCRAIFDRLIDNPWQMTRRRRRVCSVQNGSVTQRLRRDDDKRTQKYRSRRALM